MASRFSASERAIDLTIVALRGGNTCVKDARSDEYGLGSRGAVVSDHFPLTHKLLARPPFAFIHAIVIEAHGLTGFGGHTALSDTELSANFPQKSERADRVAFLIKLLAYIDHVLRHSTKGVPSIKRKSSIDMNWGDVWIPCVILVSPTKLLAGKEPDRTLGMLQKLAIAARKVREDHTRAVHAAQHIKGDRPTKGDSSSEALERATPL